MTEEEAIDVFKSPLLKDDGYERHQMAIETILDLYNKQKEEIEECETRLQEEINENCKLKYELYGNSINKAKIRDKKKKLEKLYEKEMKPYRTEFGLNLSLLTKKEKEEVINKRNSLLIAITTLKELLEEGK